MQTIGFILLYSEIVIHTHLREKLLVPPNPSYAAQIGRTTPCPSHKIKLITSGMLMQAQLEF